jgi:hypothetical protein
VHCWGLNTLGQASVPPSLGDIVDVSAGGYRSCATDLTGRLTCWGDTGIIVVPSSLGPVAQVSVGGSTTCAIETAGALRCFGYAFH